jgi:polar amino acid transport system permease protein
VPETWSPSARELERRSLRRRQRLQRVATATAVTVVVLGLAGWAVTLTPGWDRFQETFLSWEDAEESFPGIRHGFWLNVKLFLICEVFILVLGLAVALARQARSAWLAPLRVVAVIYTDVFRGVPTILLVLVMALGVPALNLQGLTNDPYIWAGVALVLSYGAYVAEVFRSGIDSIHPSQVNSASALGLSRAQAMRFVVVPQAVRRVVPPLLNDFVSLQKDTALVSVAGVFDAMFQARDYSSYHFNYTSYVVVGLFFIVLTVPLARFCDWLQRRWMERERAGAL